MKVVLVEDRIIRLKKFELCNLSNEDNISIITGKSLDEFWLKIDKSDTSMLVASNCIICHRSALNINQREFIKKHCESTHTPLVFFSGGLSSNVYYDTKYPFLNISASTFYSENLLVFLKSLKEGEKVNIRFLQYGEKYYLNDLLDCRNKLNIRKQQLIKNERKIRVRDLALKESIRTKLQYEWLKENNFTALELTQIDLLITKVGKLIYEETFNTL